MRTHRLHHSCLVLLGLICLSFLVPAPVVLAASEHLKEKQEAFRKLQRELDEERRLAEEKTAKEAALRRQLRRVEADLNAKEAALRRLQAQIDRQARAIIALTPEIGRVESTLAATRALLHQRLRALYKQGYFGTLLLLLSADGLTEVGRRIRYLSAIAAQDRRLLRQHVEALAELKEKQDRLTKHRESVTESRARLKATRAAITHEKWRQGILLAKVKEEKKGHLTAIRELEKASANLQGLIDRLRREETLSRRAPAPLGADSSASLKGRLPWPVSGELLSHFGRQRHPRFNTTIINKGIGISAPAGHRFRAIYGGIVVYADWFLGYGKLIILDHGRGFFTLYAHAADLTVQVGDTVQAGQVIGHIGETGSLDGPQLYFELRIRGKPEDPLVWLIPQR